MKRETASFTNPPSKYNCRVILGLRKWRRRKTKKIMKPIHKDELYDNLAEFLKGKGVQLTEGRYSTGIQAGCSMLADAINLSQAGLERAKTEIERKMDQVRQVIHEKTAPRGKTHTAANRSTTPGHPGAKTKGAAPDGKTKGRAGGSRSRRSRGK
jgi:hypothetical protein